MAGYRDLVAYFVEVQGVPVHAREEGGLWEVPRMDRQPQQSIVMPTWRCACVDCQTRILT